MKRDQPRNALRDITNARTKRTRLSEDSDFESDDAKTDSEIGNETSDAEDANSLGSDSEYEEESQLLREDEYEDGEEQSSLHDEYEDNEANSSLDVVFVQTRRDIMKEVSFLGETFTREKQMTNPIIAPDAKAASTLTFTAQTMNWLRWLFKAQDFVLQRSLAYHGAWKRIEESQDLQIPQLIIQRGTPLLGRLLDSITNQTQFYLTFDDIRQHWNLQEQNNKDCVAGVYARFGIGQASNGKQVFDAEILSLRMPDQFVPSFIYVGESKNMRLRSLTHDLASLSSSTLHYQHCRNAKATLQLPLIILRNEDIKEGFDQEEYQKICEGILIAGLGTYSNEAYNAEFFAHGLRRLTCIPGVNGSPTQISQFRRHSGMITTSFNPTLVPLLEKLLNAFIRQKFCQHALQRNQHCQVLLSKETQAQKAFQNARNEYLQEKGRLLSSGQFLCYGHLIKKGNYLRLNNLYQTLVPYSRLQLMREKGIAKEINEGSFIFHLRLIDNGKASDQDFYRNTIPDLHGIAKGIQLLASKSDLHDSIPLISLHGGPSSVSMMRKGKALATRLMNLLIESIPSKEQRFKDLSRLLDWKFDEELLEKLSMVQINLLKGIGRITVTEGGRREEPVHFYVCNPGFKLTILATSTFQSFAKSNPWFDRSARTFLRINPDGESSNELHLSKRVENISSLQIPFTLEAWSYKHDWISIKMQSRGGKELLRELVAIGKIFKIPFRENPKVVVLPSLPPDAPRWINFEANIKEEKGKLNYLRAYFYLKYRLREGLEQGSYTISFAQHLIDEIQLVRDQPICVYLDFWTYESKDDYRVLITKKGLNSWYSIPFPSSLRSDLHAFRSRYVLERTKNASGPPSLIPGAPEWINYEVKVRIADKRRRTLIFYLSLKRRLQGANKCDTYTVSLSRDVEHQLQLQENDQLCVFIDFWTYECANQYQILINKKQHESSWISIRMPETLRRDLFSFRSRQLL